jgi:DtxR family Mn-dependent transcriptional regulator
MAMLAIEKFLGYPKKMSAQSIANSSAGGSRPALTEPQEDYLKQIYLLAKGDGRVSTQALARRLQVRPASVTEMVGRLAQLGLVEHAPYHGVSLTEAGRRVALEMLRHHRLLETYLVQVLGYGWDEVHEEAERLEHVISERFEAGIAEVMGHPTHDPHGDPIPSPDLSMPNGSVRIPLTALAPGERGVLGRVGLQDRETLELLHRHCVVPGTTIEMLGETSAGFQVRAHNKNILIPPHLAEELWIEGPKT